MNLWAEAMAQLVKCLLHEHESVFASPAPWEKLHIRDVGPVIQAVEAGSCAPLGLLSHQSK